MSGGVVLEVVNIPLEANGQAYWFIDAAFPAADTPNFVGPVRYGEAFERLNDGVAQRSGFATPPRPRTSLQGFRRCETVLQEIFDWR